MSLTTFRTPLAYVPVKSKLKHAPRAYPGHLTSSRSCPGGREFNELSFPRGGAFDDYSYGVGNLIASLDFVLWLALIPRGVINALMHSKRKIPDSWRTGWKAKACTNFALYLKIFKRHLYYLWHVRVLSIKPCLHTQLPEDNKSYWKVSRGWGHLITWNGPILGFHVT